MSKITKTPIKVKEHFSTHALQASNYAIRTETYEGKPHLVVPVIMMVEGVHCGSHGPILHTIDELGKYAAAWNGIPIPVLHPQENGNFISANSPDILQSQKVGRVFNTHVDGKKLKAECWLDKEKLQNISPTTLTMILNGNPLDVSVGVFTDDDPVSGNWDGVDYTAIARNHRPDHLALLPGETGACSWDKGCGIRANLKGGEIDVKDLLELKRSLAEDGLGVVQVNQDPAYQDIIENIRTQLYSLDGPTKSYYLEEVFDEYFIFEILSKPLTDTGPSQSKLYKHTYTVDENGVVTFTGEPEEVVRKVDYVTAMMKGGIRMERGDNKKGCCPEKVELLVQSKFTEFGEGDRSWLETLEQEKIDKLIVPVANAEADAKAKAELEAEEAKKAELEANKKKEGDTPVTAPKKEDILKAFQESVKTPEEFLQILPAGMRDQFANGLKLHNSQRTKLIDAITAHSSAFTKAELEAESMERLEKLAGLIPVPVDYSGLGAGGNPQTNTGGIAPLLPMGAGKEEKGGE